ncbi:hypothetical protein KM043_011590 [Ampulex compressa]|nr:hypothetical protein KM043_011590 [Ampulex compressa]
MSRQLRETPIEEEGEARWKRRDLPEDGEEAEKRYGESRSGLRETRSRTCRGTSTAQTASFMIRQEEAEEEEEEEEVEEKGNTGPEQIPSAASAFGLD